ncbi:type II toxin-antitoxin system ParD family antitoxin [Phormidium sp. FACHB-1136]|uniref:ribbon-helix-helix domain-containing protein n=1 Tax=Phormidium sp. FACHB-1136 TaxID=2692848 RepID=UPI00168A1FD9|nr:type II toxin-antitoxin system ParD family antitoxin [Phormidium sp. FACHB-1136]MBD2429079.1 type II toxin-antitoxin system ParD family antitoxin [Phormidium sp. FACHB-1136]
MDITLTPELEQYLQSKVSSGEYASPNEVFLVGIRLLQDLEQTYQGRFEELRNEVRFGLEAAERGEVVDSDGVFNRLAAILADSESLKPKTSKGNDYAPQTSLGQQL